VSAPDHLPALATPAEVAEYLHTTSASLTQNRYRGTGPKFIKRGSRVLYRWSDVVEWLDRNTIQRTDDPRPHRRVTSPLGLPRQFAASLMRTYRLPSTGSAQH
jgi:hypothetical protein